MAVVCFFFQAEDGIRDLVRSRGLGDVYKRQGVRRRRCDRQQGRPGQHPDERETSHARLQRCTLDLSLIHI